MKKKYKKKLRSGISKPYKMGWNKRWNVKEQQKLDELEHEIDDAIHHRVQ